LSKACPDRERLLAFVEGTLDAEASASVRRHISSCASCGEAVREISRLTGLLRSAGSRGLSPDDECPEWGTTAAYADGLLRPKERQSAERHIAGCDSCLRLLGELWSVDEVSARANARSVERSVLERLERDARTAIVAWREGTLALVRGFARGLREAADTVAAEGARPTVAAATVRGSTSIGFGWRGDGGLSLECEVRGADGRPSLLGMVSMNGEPDPSTSVALRSRELDRGPETPDAMGRFGPWPLTPGENTVILSGARVPGGSVELRLELVED